MTSFAGVKNRRWFVAIWLIPLIVNVIGCSTRTFTNPLFRGQDPWVIYEGGTYFYSGAYCGIADICVKQARTITGLAKSPWIGVWSHPSESSANAKEIWAPELHRLNGDWYIYYSADDGQNDHHRLFVLSSTNGPIGPFEEAETGLPHGRMNISPNTWAIDPDAFTAANGKHYLTWSCTPGPTSSFPQQICLAELLSPTTVSTSIVLSKPTEPWETRDAPIQEGPVGYTKNGRTFITYSGSASFIANDYAVGLLSLKSGGEPLKKEDWQKTGPIFDHYGSTYGPGSVVFLLSPDHTQYWNMYHAVDSLECKPAYSCRSIRLQPMKFRSDGSPDLGNPIDRGIALQRPSGESR